MKIHISRRGSYLYIFYHSFLEGFVKIIKFTGIYFFIANVQINN